MHVTVDVTEGVLHVSGRVDVLTVAELREALHTAVDAGVGDLIVDVGGLELVDATGLGALLSAHRRARRAGRRLVLRAVGPDLHRVLHRTRLDRIIALEPAAPGGDARDTAPEPAAPVVRLRPDPAS
ncbi:MAG TPA: STAS domain-containing protein [Mycobacteriales bacterium]|nr:STAS domain-containing protein [Mycobacteriales bacterium]